MEKELVSGGGCKPTFQHKFGEEDKGLNIGKDDVLAVGTKGKQ